MALDFDGNDQYVTVSQILTTPTEISICGWFKADDTSAEYRVVAFNNKEPYISFRLNEGGTANKIQGTLYDNVSTKTIDTSSYTVTNWNHICATGKESDNFHLYVNGVEIGSGVSIGNFSYVNVGGQINNVIGAGRTYNYPFLGLIGDVRVYNRVLSLAEDKVIYEGVGSDNIVNGLEGRWLMNELSSGSVATGAGSVKDISPAGNHGTAVNDPIYRPAPMRLYKPQILTG